MTKTLKMNYDGAEIIGNSFYDARDDLGSKKKGFPENVDGDGGTEYIVGTIAKIVGDASDIAIYSELGGDKMTNTMDKTKKVNEGVAQTFRKMEKRIP